MEKKTVTTDKIAFARKHVEAVSAMLLGNRRLEAGAAILGGEPLDLDKRLSLAHIAALSDTDVVYLQFDDTAEGYRMTDISIVMPRDNTWYTQTGCRLHLSKSGSRAVILPQPYVRGMFRFAPDEIVQVDRKPIDIDAGIQRAEARLRKLVASGVNLSGQIEITEYAVAA